MAKEWHDLAREMKRNGFSLQEIADKFDVGRTYASKLTKDIPSSYVFKPGRPPGTPNPPHPRSFTRAVNGHQSGALKRVAVSFTDEQMAFVNGEAERLGKSFSAAVSHIIDQVQGNI